MATVLVTGATGYIGGRLLPRLLEAGHRVRCLVRDPSRFDAGAWPGVEVAVGDALRPETLGEALAGVDAVHYLIHSMGGAGGRFEHRDREAALALGSAVAAAGVGRIVYLGGLGRGRLSPHLRSRQETGDALRASGVPVTEFRAGVIVGSGSSGFEMLRALTERLPVMVAPRWVLTRCQPIGVRDVLRYLVECLEVPESAGRVIEIGGADVVTYLEMLRTFARLRGLRRRILVVPVLTPRLSRYWVTLVTPIPAAVARPLIEGLRTEVVVGDDAAERLFAFRPGGLEASMRLALDRMRSGGVESTWGGAGAAVSPDPPPAERLVRQAGMLGSAHRAVVEAPPARTFAVVASLGGARGWLFWDALWRLRGLVDRAVGGVGMRRGRRDPARLRVGDPVDFWRVEAVADGRRLLLRAEMRLPGRAWLELAVCPHERGSRVDLTALFEPRGLGGYAYWYALAPFHRPMFRGLLRAVAREASLRGSPAAV